MEAAELAASLSDAITPENPEGVVTDMKIIENAKLSYKVMIKVPFVYAHSRNVFYKSYFYEGGDLDGLDDPSNWKEDPNAREAFTEGLTDGWITGLTSGVVSFSLKYTYRMTRLAQMSKWNDVGRGVGQTFKLEERAAAVDLELTSESRLAASMGKGDFVGLTGKYAGKVIDGMAPPLEALSQKTFMKEFLKSVDNHVEKLTNGVDVTVIDFKNFSKMERGQVMRHVKDNYPKLLDKVVELN
jgi:hypothetical protein